MMQNLEHYNNNLTLIWITVALSIIHRLSDSVVFFVHFIITILCSFILYRHLFWIEMESEATTRCTNMGKQMSLCTCIWQMGREPVQSWVTFTWWCIDRTSYQWVVFWENVLDIYPWLFWSMSLHSGLYTLLC